MTPNPHRPLTTAEKTERIRQVTVQAGVDLRERYPVLKHQDAIGAAILIGSLLGMVGAGALYYFDLIAWYVCIPLVALFASLTHELEHDLIHLMYFRKSPRAHNLMLWGVWLARPSTISPWVRRRMHFHHHKHSGTEHDLEERAITNGEPWGLRRLLMTGDQMLALYLRPVAMARIVHNYIRQQKVKSPAERRQLVREQLGSYFPLGVVYYALWHGFLAFHAVDLIAAAAGHSISWPTFTQPVVAVVNFLAVVWLAPNAWRMFCLHFISSNMHYYGDIEPDNVLQQCQVLNSPWLLPFNLFCFNFGSTHAIHHFVVKEPFYVRHLTAGAAHAVMREMGVRFNDWGTFGRGNRFYAVEREEVKSSLRF